jgi:Flp pilus assembly protein TadG
MIRAFRNLRRDQDGAAVIELAIVAPVLALMTIGVVDLSNGFSRKLQLEQGAQRAVEKVMQTTGVLSVEDTIANEVVCQVNGTNADGTCKTAPVTTSDVAVTHRIECDGVVDTDESCADDQTKAVWLKVTVSSKYEPLFPVHFAGLDDDGTYHIQAAAGMRTQ